jgi:hypothetical protein
MVVLLLNSRGLSLDVPTGRACNRSPIAQWLPDVPHSCRSILGFHFPLKNCHIALEIYVVPFSNAKVVGSFRMARLNMFRRWSLKFLQPDIHRQPVVNFSEVLLITEW